MAADVEHEPAAGAGLLGHGEPGEFLQRVEGLAPRSDQRTEVLALDRDDGSVVLDVEVDVAVEVDDVEQLLEVVGCDVALLHEQAAAVLRLVGGVVRLRCGLLRCGLLRC